MADWGFSPDYVVNEYLRWVSIALLGLHGKLSGRLVEKWQAVRLSPILLFVGLSTVDATKGCFSSVYDFFVAAFIDFAATVGAYF